MSSDPSSNKLKPLTFHGIKWKGNLSPPKTVAEAMERHRNLVDFAKNAFHSKFNVSSTKDLFVRRLNHMSAVSLYGSRSKLFLPPRNGTVSHQMLSSPDVWMRNRLDIKEEEDDMQNRRVKCSGALKNVLFVSCQRLKHNTVADLA